MSNKTVEEIKISNELLSWVFGCECEITEYFKNNEIMFHVSIMKWKSILKRGDYLMDAGFCESPTNKKNLVGRIRINLHTFIHLAEIKAFECGYELFEGSKSIDVIDIEKSEET